MSRPSKLALCLLVACIAASTSGCGMFVEDGPSAIVVAPRVIHTHPVVVVQRSGPVMVTVRGRAVRHIVVRATVRHAVTIRSRQVRVARSRRVVRR